MSINFYDKFMEKEKKLSKKSLLKDEDIYSKYDKWMKVVLRRAKEVGKIELPISALIIDEKGRCIGRGTNKRQLNKDPLGHAELIALRQAALIKGDWRFNDCMLVVNLEPCQMCSGALVQARMGKVVFGAKDSKRGGLGGSIDLSTHKSAHHKMEIISGIYPVSLPGHTPGHSGFRIDDGNTSFVQMGDVLHTPNLQLADPNISVLFDIDVEQGLKSRKQAFDMVCNDRIICSGGHILEPKFGYLDKFGNGYKYVAI